MANLRKQKIDRICTKIATFLVSETYTDEPDVQQDLTKAIEYLDRAAKMMVANDEKATKAASTTPEPE